MEHTNSISPWVRRGGPVVAVTALVMYLAVYAQWPTLRMQVDLMVYRFAGERLMEGLDLYSIGLTGKPGELLFIYPPFAAICAVPLALLNDADVRLLWLLGTVAALTYAVVRMLKSMGMRTGGALVSLAALLIGVIAWLEPMRLTAELGQINVVLLVLVVGDLLATGQSKWSGIGIGLAAGLKLTPALFIVYLVATRRIRAAVVATATFAGTVGLGFAVAPSDSTSYWLHGRFDDVNRISHDPLANTSVARIGVALARFGHGSHHRRGGCRRRCRRDRRNGVSTRSGSVGGCRCRIGIGRRVTVQLEPPLGVVRAVGRSSRIPGVRRRQQDRRRGNVAAVRPNRGLDRGHCWRYPAGGHSVTAARRHLDRHPARRLCFRVPRGSGRHGGLALASPRRHAPSLSAHP